MARVLLRSLLPCLLAVTASAFAADGLENAYYVCDVFAKTGISTECKASNANQTIDVNIATTPAEAEQVCALIVRTMAEKRRAFGGRWQLRIFAPEQTADPLAACALR